MDDSTKPRPVATALFLLFLLTFFGGGLLLFINLFVPFLPEEAFALIALVVGSMLVVLAVVGKCIEAIKWLRVATDTEPTDDSPAADE